VIEFADGMLVAPRNPTMRHNMGCGVVVTCYPEKYTVLFPKIGKRYNFPGHRLMEMSKKKVKADWSERRKN